MEQLYTHKVISQRIKFLIFRLLIVILQLEYDAAACMETRPMYMCTQVFMSLG